MKCGRTSGRFSRSLSMLSAKAVVSPRYTPVKLSSRPNECARGRKRRCTSASSTAMVWPDDPSAAMWLPCVWTTPLGGAGGARGVHDRRGLVRLPLADAAVQLVPDGRETLPPLRTQRRPREQAAAGLRRVRPVDDHDLLEAVHLPAHLEHLRELGGVLDDQGLHPGVVDDVLDEV